MDFLHKVGDYTLYLRAKRGVVILITTYIDDILMIGNCTTNMCSFKNTIYEKFEISKLLEGIFTLYLKIEYINFFKKSLWFKGHTFKIFVSYKINLLMYSVQKRQLLYLKS